jgi:hypothetical protein
MNRYILCFVAALTAVSSVALVRAAVPKLDIAGLAIGMSEDDAIPALKAHNAHFGIEQHTSTLPGISEPIKPLVNASVSASDTSDAESITLLFTMPPGKKVLWGIQRTVGYLPNHRPSAEATIAALRQKYGPESIPPAEHTGNANLVWIFDAKGNLVPSNEAMGPYMRCTATMQSHFGGVGSPLYDLQNNPNAAAAEANTLTLITANVQYVNRPNTPAAVYNLIVSINDGPLYARSWLATRERVLQATNAEAQKEKKAVDQRGAPAL